MGSGSPAESPPPRAWTSWRRPRPHRLSAESAESADPPADLDEGMDELQNACPSRPSAESADRKPRDP